MNYPDRRYDGRNKSRGPVYRNQREFNNNTGRGRNYYSNDKPRNRGYPPRNAANGYVNSYNDNSNANKQANSAPNPTTDMKMFMSKLSHSNGKIVTMTHMYGYISAVHGELLFFPYDQYNGNINKVQVGDKVSFDIKYESDRPYGISNCRIAYNIQLLPKMMEQNGDRTDELANVNDSSDYETIINEKPLDGSIIATSEKLTDQATDLENSAFAIKYIDNNGQENTIPLELNTETRQSLRIGDKVQFDIATDKKNGQKHPINLLICNANNLSSNESNNKGVILTYGERSGLIDSICCDSLVHFPIKEIINPDMQLSVLNQVEFTMMTDPNTNKSNAMEVRILPHNTFEYADIDTIIHDGLIEKSCLSALTFRNGKDTDVGLLSYYDKQGIIQILRYFPKDIYLSKSVPEFGDKVRFNILTTKKLKKIFATNIVVSSTESKKTLRGFVATLKDNYGFLEDYNHCREIYFHYSSVKTPLQYLNIGTEVEFSLEVRNDKVCAENVIQLPTGTLVKEVISPEVLNGTVERALLVPEKQGIVFEGIIKLGDQSEKSVDSGQTTTNNYSFLSSSMITSKVVLQDNEKVKFQLATNPQTGKVRAVNVEPVRQVMVGRIESMKGDYGFIEYHEGEFKNFFFHMNDVSRADATFKVGDTVQFVIQQQRNGKTHAIQIRTISSKGEYKGNTFSGSLISNERNNVSIIRQPKGPDGTRGFQYKRLSSNTSAQEST
ncbi:Cold shock domain-containing protein E1 [Trichoplax sp. H2]|nr:Cold shock domain-containing protein E1 [Trichoplax sp. H2]|eukprot:RDD46600.1 Cold shock domain-containing protein E1 [Trichoplax sp. H2]